MSNAYTFYGMNRDPFPREIRGTDQRYLSKDLTGALNIGRYGVQERGISMICGDIGRGVSYSAYCLSEDLSSSRYNICYMPVCHVSPRDFYKELCRITGAVPLGKGRQAMITAIRKLADEQKSKGRPLVLILDNAQNIPELVFMDLLTLTAEDYYIANRMSLLLYGTKNLKYRFIMDTIPELEQSLVSHYQFKGLSEDETVEYIFHRLKNAGAGEEILKPNIARSLYSLSVSGTCREIDNIMRDAIMIGSQAGRKEIDFEVIRAAAANRKLNS